MTFTQPVPSGMKDELGRTILSAAAPKGASKQSFLKWAQDVVTGYDNESLSPAEQNLVWLAYQSGQVDTAGNLLFDVVAQARPGPQQRSGMGMKRGTDVDVKNELYAVQEQANTGSGKRAGYARPAGGPTGPAQPKPTQSAATGGALSPDLTSSLTKAGAPSGFSEFLKQHPEFQPTNTGNTVTYWSDVGVDPDAQIYGIANRSTQPPHTTRAGGPGSPVGQIPGTGTSSAALGEPLPTVSSQQSADEWLKSLYTMATPDLVALQHRLWDQGWYEGTNIKDASQIHFGQVDAVTQQAFGQVLGETARYNHAGNTLPWDAVLNMGAPYKGQAKAAKVGQPAQRTAVSTLTNQIRGTAQANIGRELGPDAEHAFVTEYRGQEEAARREGLAAAEAGKDSMIEGPGAPSDEAQAYIDAHNLTDKVAYGAAVRQQAFFDMLKSPV